MIHFHPPKRLSSCNHDWVSCLEKYSLSSAPFQISCQSSSSSLLPDFTIIVSVLFCCLSDSHSSLCSLKFSVYTWPLCRVGTDSLLSLMFFFPNFPGFLTLHPPGSGGFWTFSVSLKIGIPTILSWLLSLPSQRAWPSILMAPLNSLWCGPRSGAASDFQSRFKNLSPKDTCNLTCPHPESLVCKDDICRCEAQSDIYKGHLDSRRAGLFGVIQCWGEKTGG